MGYYLEAFICRKLDATFIIHRFNKAVAIELDDSLSLIPMTEELFDEINELSSSPSINNFQYMTEYVEQRVLDTIGDSRFAYVEAEYFGGEGGQMAIVWSDKRRQQILSFGEGRINAVLKDFGVIARDGYDEFMVIGLLRQRCTRDWVDDEVG